MFFLRSCITVRLVIVQFIICDNVIIASVYHQDNNWTSWFDFTAELKYDETNNYFAFW